MSKMNLCSACERHVYADEPACPFCGSRDPRLPAAEGLSHGRLSRAASHAVRAAILVGAVACSKVHEPDAGASDAAIADAALFEDAGTIADAAAPEDAATPEDAGDAAVADAGSEDAGMEDAGPGIPIYGGVFPDPRKRAVV
jgi:hypothetical protein